MGLYLTSREGSLWVRSGALWDYSLPLERGTYWFRSGDLWDYSLPLERGTQGLGQGTCGTIAYL